MAYRNQIDTVWANFFAHMQTLDDGATPPFRSVVEGETTPYQYEHPFVGVQCLSAKPIERTGADKKWSVKCRIRVTTTSPGTNQATEEILEKMAVANDHIEAYVKPDGVAGFEDMDWSITDNITPDEGNVSVADSTFTFTVMVTRGMN